MISLTNYDFQWGRSEVVIICPVMCLPLCLRLKGFKSCCIEPFSLVSIWNRRRTSLASWFWFLKARYLDILYYQLCTPIFVHVCLFVRRAHKPLAGSILLPVNVATVIPVWTKQKVRLAKHVFVFRLLDFFYICQHLPQLGFVWPRMGVSPLMSGVPPMLGQPQK